MITRKDLQYLALCEFGASLFSTCGKRQYMAIVLDGSGRVDGMGYNGSPPGQPHCKDGFCPRLQANSQAGSTYDNCISIHAEQNAIMYSKDRAVLYVNGMPCSTCAKLIAGSGVKRIVGIRDDAYVASRETIQMLETAGIEILLAEYREVISCAAMSEMVV